MADKLEFFHAAPSRSGAILILLEELGVNYEMHLLNLKDEEQHKPDYKAINPLGKVPAIRHNGIVVTEQSAIALYLADRFPAAGLAPAINDPLRASYLRWIIFYSSAFEPAIIDRSLKRDAGQRGMSPYGDYDAVIATVIDQLKTGPWFLGERYTAADTIWGSALNWMSKFGLLPADEIISDYVTRFQDRPNVKAAREKDKQLGKS